jgi:hypothetical protein
VANPKLQVYTCVLKQQRPFKAATIFQQTGLSRSLIQYHLTKLIDDGFLEKDGMYYCLVARNDLLDSLTDVSSNNVMGLLTEQSGYLNDYRAINEAIHIAVLARCAGMPGNLELKNNAQQTIDDTIDALKGLKRYLNSKQIDRKQAVRELTNDDEYSANWDVVKNAIQKAGYSRKEWDDYTLKTRQELKL